jgi:hypothetical protein
LAKGALLRDNASYARFFESQSTRAHGSSLKEMLRSRCIRDLRQARSEIPNYILDSPLEAGAVGDENEVIAWKMMEGGDMKLVRNQQAEQASTFDGRAVLQT